MKRFVDGFIDNDEKVASSMKHTKFKTRVQKPYPIYDQNVQNVQNGQNGYLFLTKTTEKPYHLKLHIPI